MNLPQIRLVRILQHPRAMLDRRARVRVALDAQPHKQPNLRVIALRQGMRGAAADRRDAPNNAVLQVLRMLHARRASL